MKRILTILLTALAMNLTIVANGAFAQNRFEMSAGDSSDSKTGDLEQWETVVDYEPFFDGVAQDLFGQSMAGFTLEYYDGHLGEYSGIALTRVDEERALEEYPYSLVVDTHIEAEFYDEVDIYYVVGSLVTGHAEFHGELAISVVSVAAEQGFYVFPLKPLTNAAHGPTGDEVRSGHHSGGERAQFSSDRAVGEAS